MGQTEATLLCCDKSGIFRSEFSFIAPNSLGKQRRGVNAWHRPQMLVSST
jgi:hypothetical protein